MTIDSTLHQRLVYHLAPVEYSDLTQNPHLCYHWCSINALLDVAKERLFSILRNSISSTASLTTDYRLPTTCCLLPPWIDDWLTQDHLARFVVEVIDAPDFSNLSRQYAARGSEAHHLKEDSLVLYDLSSSDFEGSHCLLAKLGYSRDRKQGTLQVYYGLLTDDRGCPVAVSVHACNTSGSTTFMPEVTRLREEFGNKRLGDGGESGHDLGNGR